MSSRALPLSLLFAAIVLFAGLGTRGLNEPDEGRYAEIAREMVVRTQTDPRAWLDPTLDGQPFYNKPPLIYWLSAAGMKLLGVNEWGVRLPCALAAFATVLVASLLARRMGGERWATVTALILPTTGMFFIIGRLITPDMLLTFFMTAALAAFWWWFEGAGRRALVFFWLALAGGMMTKGPVGVVVPLLVAAVTLLWLRQPRRLKQLGWGWGVPLFAVLALPWFVQAAIRFDLWNFFLGRETLGRYFTTVHKRTEPFWYYFAVLPAGLLPWTLLAPLAVWRGRLEVGGGRQREQFVFLVSWVLVPLLFFSASHSKLPTYILPTCVPAVLLVARFVDGWLQTPHGKLSNVVTQMAFGCVVLVTAALPLGFTGWLVRHDADVPSVLRVWMPAAVGALVLGLAAWAWHDARRLFAVLMVSLSVLLLACVWSVALFEDSMGSHSSMRSIGLAIHERAQPQERVFLDAHHGGGYGLDFYAGRLIAKHALGDPPPGLTGQLPPGLHADDTEVVEWMKQGQRVFCIVSPGKVERWREQSPAPLTEIARTLRHVLLVNH